MKHNLNISNLNFKLKMAHLLHYQNIQTLEMEIFKIHHGFSQISFLDLFHNYNENNFYSWWYKFNFQIPRITTTLKWTESIFVPVIWNNILIEVRSIENFDTFKTEIWKQKPKNCWWRLCKTYVKHLGFLNISQY